MPARIAYKALYAGQHISMIPMRHAHVLSSISFLGGQSMITSCMAFYPCLDLAKTEMFYTQVVGPAHGLRLGYRPYFPRKARVFCLRRLWGRGNSPQTPVPFAQLHRPGQRQCGIPTHLRTRHSAAERPCAASIPTGLFVLFGGPERLHGGIPENRWIPAYIAENFIFYKRPHKRKLSRATHALHF